MRFFEEQEKARAQTRRLLLLFGLAVIALVLAVNGALALTWRQVSPGWNGYPDYFFSVNTAVTLLFVLEKMTFGPQHHRRIVRFEEIAEGA